MKKILSMAFAILVATACDAQTTQLPAPVATGGMPIMEAFAQRKSRREFNAAEIDPQTLSNLLWATAGINRTDDGKRTNPTAMNRQEISVYVFTAAGASLYEPSSHSLRMVAKGDFRQLVASRQDFVLLAPVSIVFVGDYEKFGMSDDKARQMVAVDAGIACQNLNLFCAGAGLATVPRATMDTDGIRKVLGLTEMQEPIMNNPVGFMAE